MRITDPGELTGEVLPSGGPLCNLPATGAPIVLARARLVNACLCEVTPEAGLPAEMRRGRAGRCRA